VHLFDKTEQEHQGRRYRRRTIADADNIIVPDKGQVAEQGAHEEFLARDGFYRRLYMLQTESLGWSV
jgi:ATP-binding cassette subfamily B protein